MNRPTFALVVVLCAPFMAGTLAFAGAKEDCSIEIRKGVSGEDAYVTNKNKEKAVKVTVGVTITKDFQTKKLDDKVVELAAGQSVFLGGVKDTNGEYSFTIAGATYK